MAEDAVEPNADLSIDKLAGMSDQELAHILGFDTQIEKVKADLKAMQELTGDEREKAEENITKIFTPHICAHDFHYALSDAKENDDHMTSDEPASLMDY
jgi:hypothetical protein